MSDIDRALNLLLRMEEEARQELWRQMSRAGIPMLELGSLDPKRLVGVAIELGCPLTLRVKACENPQTALEYASRVDHGPSEDTRSAVVGHPRLAYLYARDVEREPHETTRKSASYDPTMALRYASRIDQRPHEDTRRGASQEAKSAYLYAVGIDEGFHPDTWEAVKGTPYEDVYREMLEIPEE